MKKYIMKDKINKDDITHVDQEIKDLQFSCFHLLTGKIIIIVTGDEAKINEWILRHKIDVSEMTIDEYDNITKVEIKEVLKLEIIEDEKMLQDKKDKLALMESHAK